jgi:hypothetical protein
MYCLLQASSVFLAGAWEVEESEVGGRQSEAKTASGGSVGDGNRVVSG